MMFITYYNLLYNTNRLKLLTSPKGPSEPGADPVSPGSI